MSTQTLDEVPLGETRQPAIERPKVVISKRSHAHAISLSNSYHQPFSFRYLKICCHLHILPSHGNTYLVMSHVAQKQIYENARDEFRNRERRWGKDYTRYSIQRFEILMDLSRRQIDACARYVLLDRAQLLRIPITQIDG